MYKLRGYQEEAVQATLRHFRRSRQPVVVVLPTGAGKSLVIAELARLARGRVLVLAHVKELVEQNYAKYTSYGLAAGIYSAGLNQKNSAEKVIFGSIQSVARADGDFFADFSLLVIDECHRVSGEEGTQYDEVIRQIHGSNPQICVLGLTATPYRLDTGWIYQYHAAGHIRTTEPRLFQRCIYELGLGEMISAGHLTPPVQIDAPVASYDFSTLTVQTGRTRFSLDEIELILKDQARVTPGIVHNIVEISRGRAGVLIFTSSVRHAEEIIRYLPPGSAALVLGDTPSAERDELINRFKGRELKFLVNVSVLTTGFDAPHVDVVAILRPTESVSLYQQIVGRGLRLAEGKKDCLVLDYTGVPHDIFAPQIHDRRPTEGAVPVKVACPECSHVNDFWGLIDSTGGVVEHFGAACRGARTDPVSGEIMPCGFRYRFKACERCGTENDIGANRCLRCGDEFRDSEASLRETAALKDTHVMRPDSMTFERKIDRQGRERLEIRYYDLQAQHLSEVFFFGSLNDAKVFYYNFVRMHDRNPGARRLIASIDEALAQRDRFRLPLFVIARKQDRYWKIREKLFL
jgi:DNA repair protein RadD